MIDKKVLGRGLSSLISENTKELNLGELDKEVLDLSILDIVPNKFQPRKVFDEDALNELAESIKIHGVLQPILVRKIADQYELIAGERRYQASKKAGKTQIPAIVFNLSDDKMLEFALIENIQREGLNPIEEGEGFKALIEKFSHTQEALSSILGKSRSYISNSIRLLSLPQDVKDKLSSNRLSVGHARALVGRENASELADLIEKNNLNVRDVERLVRGELHLNRDGSDFSNLKREVVKDEEILSIERGLTELLGMKVYIKLKADGGQLVINFSDLESLDCFIRKISDLNF